MFSEKILPTAGIEDVFSRPVAVLQPARSCYMAPQDFNDRWGFLEAYSLLPHSQNGYSKWEHTTNLNISENPGTLQTKKITKLPESENSGTLLNPISSIENSGPIHR